MLILLHLYQFREGNVTTLLPFDFAFLGSTPNLTAISTDSSNFAEATSLINAEASFKE